MPIFFATYIRGGLGQESAFFVAALILSISLPRSGFPATTRPSRARRRGAGKDESDPPFFAALSANRAGGLWQGLWHTLPPPFWGVALV